VLGVDQDWVRLSIGVDRDWSENLLELEQLLWPLPEPYALAVELALFDPVLAKEHMMHEDPVTPFIVTPYRSSMESIDESESQHALLSSPRRYVPFQGAAMDVEVNSTEEGHGSGSPSGGHGVGPSHGSQGHDDDEEADVDLNLSQQTISFSVPREQEGDEAYQILFQPRKGHDRLTASSVPVDVEESLMLRKNSQRRASPLSVSHTLQPTFKRDAMGSSPSSVETGSPGQKLPLTEPEGVVSQGNDANKAVSFFSAGSREDSQ